MNDIEFTQMRNLLDIIVGYVVFNINNYTA